MAIDKREADQRFTDVFDLLFGFGVAALVDLRRQWNQQAAEQQDDDEQSDRHLDQREAAAVLAVGAITWIA